MQSAWKASKFLANNSSSSSSTPLSKEGRKLNLSERIQASKPESIFFRYATKNDIINQFIWKNHLRTYNAKIT